MPSDTTVISVVGILTSGVLGPAAAAQWARRQQRREFDHDRSQRRHENLQDVLDEAAVLLSAGATNLRITVEAASNGDAVPADVIEWASKVHSTLERLQLRLPEGDPVTERYSEARDALDPIARAMDPSTKGSSDIEVAVTAFEAKRSAFLAAARHALTKAQSTGHNRSILGRRQRP